jgi:hypothetical protein
MITYNWQIAQMERNTSNGFIVKVYYRVKAVDGDYSASTYDSCGYNQSEESFIPYEDLTEETVIGWVKQSIDAKTVEASLASQIEDQKAPATQSGLPWA